MKLLERGVVLFMFLFVCCTSTKQIYNGRIVNSNNKHIYVNDSLDFSISYFDIIRKQNQQTSNINLKKTTVPPEFQKHLKSSVKKPSEILFQAHRATMSQEDILVVLYDKKTELPAFSKKIIKQISRFIPQDSLDVKEGMTVSDYLSNNKAFPDNTYQGSDFMQMHPFNALRYIFHNAQSDYKIHEFHVPFDKRRILRLIWIADIRKTVALKGWETIDDQNHYLELFTLNDSAKFHLQEIVPDNPFKIAADAFKKSGYSGAVNSLISFESTVETKGTFQQKSMFYQALMTYCSFLGNHKKSLEYTDKAFGGKPPVVSDSVFMDYKTVDAANYILQKADNQHVIMFNEAHNCGQHRAFLRDILRGLYQKGFRYLALEDLAQADSINKRGYPLRGQNGFYSLEPTFSQALREAKEVGFTLLGYDDETEQREERQAENIYKILKDDPSAKVIVWAGHSHIYENPIGSDKPRMAYFFKKLSNINPLTIETTVLREHSKEEYESGYYRAALKKTAEARPFVMLKQDSCFVMPDFQNVVDIQIFFPRTNYSNDYPDWMGNSTTHFYELTLDKEHFKDKLLKIFRLKEYSNDIEMAVPVMNIPLSRIGIFKLYLEPQKYVAVIRDSENWEYFYKEFEIKY